MGPSALALLIDSFAEDGRPSVLARIGEEWGPQDAQFGADLRALAAALIGYGLRADAHAAVLGPESYGTLTAALAVLAAGAVLVPLDPAMPDDALRQALASTGAVHAIASDERQLARILALRPDLPSLELVLLVSASPSERKAPALLVDAAIDVGRRALEADPDILRRASMESETRQACVIVDAKGQGRPFGRTALVELCNTIVRSLNFKKQEVALVALPVGSLERLGVCLAVLSRGARLLLSHPDGRPDDGLEDRPADAILLDVPRLERLHRAWVAEIDSKSWLVRTATRWALARARIGERTGWKHRVADSLALKGLRQRMGERVTTLEVISGPRNRASSEVDSFFQAAGLKVRYFAPLSGSVLAR